MHDARLGRLPLLASLVVLRAACSRPSTTTERGSGGPAKTTAPAATTATASATADPAPRTAKDRAAWLSIDWAAGAPRPVIAFRE